MKMETRGTTSKERVGKLYSWGEFGFRPVGKKYMDNYDKIFDTPEKLAEKAEKKKLQDARAEEAKAEKERILKMLENS